MMHACTIVARNYLAQAQVLVDSFRKFHPDGSFHVLLIDDPATERPHVEGAEVVMLDEIGLQSSDLLRMTIAYEVIELATAVKPWMLASLLDRGFDHAVYFDPDISIERRLEELPELARQHSIVLTPHVTEPMPRDNGQPSEQQILLTGAFNLGFIAVGATDAGRTMLAWWGNRLLTDSSVDMANGFFTDQRLIDFVPGLYDHYIVKDPSWNVAYWNLATRPLSKSADGHVLVSGQPLTFFHYSGYTPAKPHLLSKHQGPEPRLKLSEQPILRELCDDYGARLLGHGFLSRQKAYRRPFDRVGDVTLDKLTRRLLRDHLDEVDRGLTEPEVDLTSGTSLAAWLDAPSSKPQIPHLSRYLEALYLSRPDVQHAFPGVRSGNSEPFFDWVQTYGIPEEGVPVERLVNGRSVVVTTTASSMISRPTEARKGVTSVHGVELAGYLTADLGLGESARQFVTSLEHAGVPVSTTTYRRTGSRFGTPWEDRLPTPGHRYDTALICVNADQLPFFREDAGLPYMRGRYRIGLWFWELSEFPESMSRSAKYLDEIWVCSEFNRAAIAPHVDIPVTVVPHPTHAPKASDAEILEVPRDDRFTFLFVFDYFSTFARKNPDGVIEAYLRAFPEVGEARLVLKTINGHKRQEDRERLRYLAADRPDIVLVERYLSRNELDYLMHRADCYVSLHRSEGFGQTLAETMAIGKPVIATNYSGNLEFTRADNAYLVSHGTSTVPEGYPPYPAGAEWAEPDLDDAARLMLDVMGDPAGRQARGARAAETIRTEFSTEALAKVAHQRLEEIWSSPAYRKRVSRQSVAAERIKQAAHEAPARTSRLSGLLRRG